MSLPDYAERADELVDRIDSGDLDPDAVDLTAFVEDDTVTMTMGLWDRLSEDKREEYNERVAERDRRELAEERQELNEQQEKAVAALTAADEDSTESVALNDDGLTVDVKTYLNDEIEHKFDRVATGNVDREEKAELFIDCLVWLIEDEQYSDRAVWEEYKRERGVSGLDNVLGIVAEPAMEALIGRDAVGNSHEAAEGS